MKTKFALILWLVAILSACSGDDSSLGSDNGGQTTVDMSEAQDASEPSDAGDLEDASLQADATNDVGSDDMGAQLPSDAGADASTDMGSADAGGICDDIVAELEANRLAAGACERPSQCGTRYNPTCPQGGCYVHYNVSNDLSALEASESQFETEMCAGGAVCDCVEPPQVLSCESGQCAECPQTCPYVCDLGCTCSKDACGCDMPVCAPSLSEGNCSEGATRIAQARDDARTCTEDTDCIIDVSPICPEVGCFFPRNRNANRSDLDTLVAEYISGGCNLVACACAAPPAAAECVEGLCQGVSP